MTSWHVSVAAEAIVAAQFARLGYDVSVQYGANQPEYDLVIVDGEDTLKVSVKGSQDGGWGLTQSHLQSANYKAAIDEWLLRHKPRTALCLVQFHKVQLSEMPRIYLATPAEIGGQLRKSANGRGGTILYEAKTWTARAFAAGTEDRIPDQWKFNAERVKFVIAAAGIHP
jgi:hypothetical protein